MTVYKRKSAKRKTKINKNFFFYFSFTFLALAVSILCGIISAINGGNLSLIHSDNDLPALIENARGEMIEVESIPTYEEIDGGRFEDSDGGLSVDGEYEDLGSIVETFDTSSPEVFKNETLGKCIYANNKYGAQCVSLARSFWFSYAGRDVSTCGTGMAKGMMNCPEQNAGNDFLVFWDDSKKTIQAGDWLVFTGGQYGHVGMALGGYNNGYVALLGENQGGGYCERGGSATNIVNINLKNLIGYYRPLAYVKPEPAPEPTPEPEPSPSPEPEEKTITYTYKKGDCFSKVLVNLGISENHLWGADGTVAYYTEQLISQNLLDPNGNVIIGIPFTLHLR